MRLSLGTLDLSGGQRYPLDGSEIPFPDLSSALALLPGYAQGDATGTLRDPLLNTIRALANRVWADTGAELNPFVSPRYSSGTMLDVWGIILQKPRSLAEDDGPYRTRLLTKFDGLTPNAIRAAVLEVAAFSFTQPAFQEPGADAMWWGDDSATASPWCSFWQSDTDVRLWNLDPGWKNPTSGGYWGPDKYGAQFWVLIQLGAGDDGRTPFWTDDAGLSASDPQDFWADEVGQPLQDCGFWGFEGDPLDLRIVAQVEALRAFGVIWLLIEDPKLTGAH